MACVAILNQIERAGAEPAVAVSSGAAEAGPAAQLLHLFASSVGAGRLDVAWNLLTPAMQARQVDYETFAGDLATTSWEALDVLDADAVGPGAVEALVQHRTRQDADFGPDGQTCSVWTVRYGLVLEAGFWKVDSSRNQIGSPEPCDVVDQVGETFETGEPLDDLVVDVAEDVAGDQVAVGEIAGDVAAPPA